MVERIKLKMDLEGSGGKHLGVGRKDKGIRL